MGIGELKSRGDSQLLALIDAVIESIRCFQRYRFEDALLDGPSPVFPLKRLTHNRPFAARSMSGMP